MTIQTAQNREDKWTLALEQRQSRLEKNEIEMVEFNSKEDFFKAINIPTDIGMETNS